MPYGSVLYYHNGLSSLTVLFFLMLGHLARPVYFVDAFVGGRLMYTSPVEHDALDGELPCQ